MCSKFFIIFLVIALGLLGGAKASRPALLAAPLLENAVSPLVGLLIPLS
jgi:hypothetical protein